MVSFCSEIMDFIMYDLVISETEESVAQFFDTDLVFIVEYRSHAYHTYRYERVLHERFWLSIQLW